MSQEEAVSVEERRPSMMESMKEVYTEKKIKMILFKYKIKKQFE